MREILCGFLAPMVIAGTLLVTPAVNAQSIRARGTERTERSSKDIDKEFELFIANAVNDIKAGKKTTASVRKSFLKQFPQRKDDATYKSFSERLDAAIVKAEKSAPAMAASLQGADDAAHGPVMAKEAQETANSWEIFRIKKPVSVPPIGDYIYSRDIGTP